MRGNDIKETKGAHVLKITRGYSSSAVNEDRLQRFWKRQEAYKKRLEEWEAIANEKHKQKAARRKANKAAARRRRRTYYYNYLRRKKRRHDAAVRRKLAWMRERYRQKKEIERLKKYAAGDTLGVYEICLTRDRVKYRKIKTFKWKSEAIAFFEGYVKEHHDEIWTPVKTPFIEEVVLVEHLGNAEQRGESFLRDPMGKLIRVSTTDESMAIINVSEVYADATFHIYGRGDERFTTKQVADILIPEEPNDVLQVCIYRRLLFVRGSADFDIVIADTSDNCRDLYLSLEKKIKQEYVFFTGQYNGYLIDKMKDDVRKKTGWSTRVIDKI